MLIASAFAVLRPTPVVDVHADTRVEHGAGFIIVRDGASYRGWWRA